MVKLMDALPTPLASWRKCPTHPSMGLALTYCIMAFNPPPKAPSTLRIAFDPYKSGIRAFTLVNARPLVLALSALTSSLARSNNIVPLIASIIGQVGVTPSSINRSGEKFSLPSTIRPKTLKSPLVPGFTSLPPNGNCESSPLMRKFTSSSRPSNKALVRNSRKSCFIESGK